MNPDSAAPLSVCLTTVGDAEQGRRLAEALLERKLAACIQIDGPIQSFYRWKGQTHCDAEYRVMLKTTTAKASELRAALAEIHPYEQPQIVTLAAHDADPGYAAWVAGEVE